MDFYDAQLQARRIAEETGLSLAEIVSLDADEFARLTGRPTPAQAALAAFEAQRAATIPQERPPAPAQTQTHEPQGIDIKNMPMREYAALRGELGLDRADAGIFGSGQATADAARFQASRTALSNASIVEPSKVDMSSRWARQDVGPSGRPGLYRGQ